jgi:hypothetical protein
MLLLLPISVAERSKTRVCGRSLAGIAGLNPAGVVDVCLVWMLCIVRQKFLRWADPSSGEDLPAVMCYHVCSRKLMNQAALARVGLLCGGKEI